MNDMFRVQGPLKPVDTWTRTNITKVVPAIAPFSITRGEVRMKPTINSNSQRTDIICIVDRSGSMQTCALDMCQAFNDFVREQRQIDLPCRMTLVQFDDQPAEIVFQDKDIREVPPLTLSPRGGTALLDAIVDTIRDQADRLFHLDTQNDDGRPGKVLVVIITDGQENRSRRFDREAADGWIAEARKQGWEFIFFGANQDAFAEAAKLGIDTGITYDSTKREHSQTVGQVLNFMATSYRSGGSVPKGAEAQFLFNSTLADSQSKG